MTDYHTTYVRPEGESTQWEDLQRKLGNLPPAPKPAPPRAFAPEEEQRKDRSFVDSRATEEELEELEDDFSDDRFLEEYRCGGRSAPHAFRRAHRCRSRGSHCAAGEASWRLGIRFALPFCVSPRHGLDRQPWPAPPLCSLAPGGSD